jgi:hypothetical protein
MMPNSIAVFVTAVIAVMVWFFSLVMLNESEITEAEYRALTLLSAEYPGSMQAFADAADDGTITRLEMERVMRAWKTAQLQQ